MKSIGRTTKIIILSIAMLLAFTFGILLLPANPQTAVASASITPKSTYTVQTKTGGSPLNLLTLSSAKAHTLATGDKVYMGYKVKSYSGKVETRYGVAMYDQINQNLPYGTGVGVMYFTDDKNAPTNDSHAANLVEAGASYQIVFTKTETGYSYTVDKTLNGNTASIVFASSVGSIDSDSLFASVHFHTESAALEFNALLEDVYCCTENGTDLGVMMNVRTSYFTITKNPPVWTDANTASYVISQKANAVSRSQFFLGSKTPVGQDEVVYLTYHVASVTGNTSAQAGVIGTSDTTANYPFSGGAGVLKHASSCALFDAGFTYRYVFTRTSDTTWYYSAKKIDANGAETELTFGGGAGAVTSSVSNFGLWFSEAASANGYTGLVDLNLTEVKCYNSLGEDLGVTFNNAQKDNFKISGGWKEEMMAKTYTLTQSVGWVTRSFFFLGTQAPVAEGDVIYLSYRVKNVIGNTSAQTGFIGTTDVTKNDPYSEANGVINYASSSMLFDLGCTYNIVFNKSLSGWAYATKTDENGLTTTLSFSGAAGTMTEDIKHFGIWFNEAAESAGYTGLVGLELDKVRCYNDKGQDVALTLNDVQKDFFTLEESQAAFIDIRNDGTFVRTASPAGIRFKGIVNAAEYDNLVSTYGADNVKIGMLIAPTDYLADTNFTISALTEKGKNHKVVETQNNLVKTETDGTEYYEFSAALVNILDNNYAREFSARAFIQVNGKTFYAVYVRSNQSRSVYGLSKSALEKTYAQLNSSQLKVINGYVNGVASICFAEGRAFVEQIDNYVNGYAVSASGNTLTITATTGDLESVKVVKVNDKYYAPSLQDGAIRITATDANPVSTFTGEVEDTLDEAHSYSVSFADKLMVNQGKTDYKIVIPAASTEYINFAKDELVRFFREATGITLEVVTDGGLTHTEGGKYISLGNTAPFTSSGISVDTAALKEDGVRIVTKDNTVYICGGEKSVLNGVYTLLKRLFDFEYFYTDTYTLKTGVSYLVFRNMDITDIPDFAVRVPSIAYNVGANAWESKETTLRMGLSESFHSGKVWVTNPTYTESANGGHNSFVYLPPSYYNDSVNHASTYRPEWFAESGNQLCYTAHIKEADRTVGDAYDQMVDKIYAVMQENLKRNLQAKYIFLGLEDAKGWCTCGACTESKNKYGSEAASVILMCNELSARIQKWFTQPAGKNYARAELYVCFFAYFETLTAPDYTKITANDGVAVTFAPVEADFTHALTHDRNQTHYSNLQNWARVCNNLMVWVYSTMYSEFFMPLNIKDSQQANYQLYKDLGVTWVLNQSQTNQKGGATGWQALKTYLDAQWSWNVNQSYAELEERFFKCYFGEAWQEMLAIYNAYLTHWDAQEANGMLCNIGTGSSYNSNNYKKATYWSKQTLTDWLSAYESALAKISGLQTTQNVKYEKLYKHIAMERLSVYYMLVELYGSDANASIWKANFKADATLIGLTAVSEVKTITDLYTDWGIA